MTIMQRNYAMYRPSKRSGNTKVKPTPCYESVGQSLVTIVNVLFRAGKWLRKKHRFFRFLKKPKNPKSPNFRFFYFLVKFYTNHIKFHILIVICEFCYILQKTLCQREWCILYRMFFLGGNFVSGH